MPYGLVNTIIAPYFFTPSSRWTRLRCFKNSWRSKVTRGLRNRWLWGEWRRCIRWTKKVVVRSKLSFSKVLLIKYYYFAFDILSSHVFSTSLIGRYYLKVAFGRLQHRYQSIMETPLLNRCRETRTRYYLYMIFLELENEHYSNLHKL